MTAGQEPFFTVMLGTAGEALADMFAVLSGKEKLPLTSTFLERILARRMLGGNDSMEVERP